MTREPELSDLLRQLIDIGIALTSQRALPALLSHILSEARRFTRAEAGTLFMREADHLRFAVVQNDVLAGRLSPEEMDRKFRDEWLPVDESSLAGYAAHRNEIINIADAYALGGDRPYTFNDLFDTRFDYRTHSVLVVPMQDPTARVVGVLELINALDAKGTVEAFHPRWEPLIRALASQAAVAIENVRLGELSYKDPLTGIYNRRYFSLRLEEEVRRRAHSGQALSVALIDIDAFKEINDTRGHGAGDYSLKEVAATLVAEPARGFSVTSRYGGDEFAVLLADTAKSGALGYAKRIRGAIARRDFAYGRLTVSIGVASIPEDAGTGEELLFAADRALYHAKRAGGNGVATA